MPNGFHGSEEGWAALEGPLVELDDVLEGFAQEHGLVLTKNARGNPDRSFRWGQAPELLIQLFVESETGPTYTLWVSASDHRSRTDYWLHRTLIKAAPIHRLVEGLEELLAAAHAQAEAWRRDYPSRGRD